tara:strand:+ start:1088 stop:2167 length:1080 start_codon:yes stop_codon:yes gene_type:complete
MSLTPDWAPNIHPIVVHFPIALLVVAVAVDLVGLFFRRNLSIRNTVSLLYCIGAASGMLAYFTGESAADAMLLPADVAPLVGEHHDWASRATWFFVFFASLRLAVSFILPQKKWIEIASFVLALGGIFMLYETAEHGALLVYRHGLGVQTITTDTFQEEANNRVSAAMSSARDEGIVDLENGSWVWHPVVGAETVMANEFTWLEGAVSELTPGMVHDEEKGPVLGLSAQEVSAIFVAGSNVASSQAAVSINLEQFDGEIRLLLHVQNSETFDFFSATKNVIQLGRVNEGVETIFEEKELLQSGWLDLQIFGGEGHFRGYVNGDLITHGHADDLEPGPFGMQIQGEGRLLVDQIQIQSIN